MPRRNRNTSSIRRVTKAMGEVMRCCAQTGLITRINTKKYMGLSLGNVEKMIKDGYIKAETVVVKGEMVNIYRLNNTGINWIKNNTLIQYMYRSNPRQIKHDLMLSQFYNQLSEKERNTWVNEHQIIKQWNKLSEVRQANKSGTVDALITSIDGGKIAIEVTTCNYGKEELKEKYNAARQLGCNKIVKVRA